MRICQITSPVVCGPHRVGQWFCSDSVMGDDGEPVIRYLQHNGSWGLNSNYFQNEAELQNALTVGVKPDFSISKKESLDRQTMRDWALSDHLFRQED